MIPEERAKIKGNEMTLDELYCATDCPSCNGGAFGKVCEHGSLKRSCEVCGLNDQLAAAKAEIETLRKLALGPIKSEVIHKLESENKRLRDALEWISKRSCREKCFQIAQSALDIGKA